MVKRNKPVLEPTTQAFVDALEAKGGKPLYTLSYEDARKVLEDAQAINVRKLPADIEDTVFPDGPTGEVSVRIYRPVNTKGLLPVVMYFHGGGWVLGSKNTHDRLLRDLVNGSDAAFVFVNYTPSPEAQFPIPVEQCYAATKYVSENGKQLGLGSQSTRSGRRQRGRVHDCGGRSTRERAKGPVDSLPGVDVPSH
jgi:acetyl esterase